MPSLATTSGQAVLTLPDDKGRYIAALVAYRMAEQLDEIGPSWAVDSAEITGVVDLSWHADPTHEATDADLLSVQAELTRRESTDAALQNAIDRAALDHFNQPEF